MSGSVFKGPMLVIILGAVAVLGVRYLPVDEMLDRIRAARVTEPPVVVLADTQAPSRTVIEPAVEAAAEPLSQAEVVFEPDSGTAGQVAAATEHLPEEIRAATVAAVATSPPKAQVTVASKPVETKPVVIQPTPNKPDVSPPASPVAPSPVAVNQETVARKPVEPEPVAPEPVVWKPVTPQPAPVTRAPAVVASIGRSVPDPVLRPTPPPVPVEAGLRVLVEADVGERSGLGKFTAESYATLLKGELETVSSEFLGAAAVQRGAPNLAFRDQLADGRPGIDRLCGQVQNQRVLLADVSIPSGGFSSVASAYWPEVRFTAINCGDGRLHKSSSKRLEPQRADRFEYQKDFSQRAHDFVASQGYFLRP